MKKNPVFWLMCLVLMVSLFLPAAASAFTADFTQTPSPVKHGEYVYVSFTVSGIPPGSHVKIAYTGPMTWGQWYDTINPGYTFTDPPYLVPNEPASDIFYYLTIVRLESYGEDWPWYDYAAAPLTLNIEHEYGGWVNNGSNHWRECVCGTKIDEAGHTYGTPVVVQPACTAAGYTRHTCTVCGYYYDDTAVAAPGHSWGSWIGNLDGTHTHICSVCHEPETAGCSFGSCISDFGGMHTRTCFVCGTPEIVICSYWDNVYDPTCTVDGYTRHICTYCGYSFNDTIVYATGHDWSDFVSNLNGTHTRTCNVSACGQPETTSCSYGSAVTDPACTEGGYTRHTCIGCGYYYDDTAVDALGHDWGVWSSNLDGTHTRICSICSTPDRVPCTYVSAVTDPTCTAEGITRYTCADCGDSYIGALSAALGHTWGLYVPNLDGTHTRICSVCSESKTADCTYESTVTAPACTESGYTRHTCPDCGDVYDDTVVAPLGHDWGAWTSNLDGTHTRVCSECSESETADCSYGSAVTAPTCIENGFTRHTCTDCGYIFDDTAVGALGHDWGVWTHDSGTSGQAGTHSRVCANDPLHVETEGCLFVTEVTVPSCTEGGFDAHTCSVCGYAYQDALTPAAGHAEGPWVVVLEPTNRSIGFREVRCTVCGALVRSEVIPRLSETWYGNTACSLGEYFRDGFPGLTDKWYMYTRISLEGNGVQDIPLIASNRYVIGTVHVSVLEGGMEVTYEMFSSKTVVLEEFLAVFPSPEGLTSVEPEEMAGSNLPFGSPVTLPEDATEICLFVRLVVDYDIFAPGIRSFHR